MAKHLIENDNTEIIPDESESLESGIFPDEAEGEPDGQVLPEKQKKPLTAILPHIVAVPLSLLILFLPHFISAEAWIITLIYAAAFAVSAFDILLTAIRRFAVKDYTSYEVLTLLSGLLAFVSGCKSEAVLLIVLCRAASLIKDFAEKRCVNNNTLKNILPEYVLVETRGGLMSVPAEDVNEGDIIPVEAGEFIPLDGIVIEGMSSVDTRAISGQSDSWVVREGYLVFAGSVNLTNPLRVRVRKTAEQSAVNRLSEIMDSAPEYKSAEERIGKKFISIYYPLLILAAVFTAAILPLTSGNWLEYLRRASILLLVSAPSTALACSTLAFNKAVGIASSKGIFVKGLDCIGSLARASTWIFEKTGVITEGRYSVTEVFPVNMSERELLATAALAESFSRHPIARALKEAAGEIDRSREKVIQAEELAGRGISAFIGKKQVYVGNAALLEEHSIKYAIPQKSGAAIHVAVNNIYCGYIMIRDNVRRGAFDALEALRVTGVKKTVLLTGDVLSVAKPLASRLNFDMLKAELTPKAKLSAAEYLMENKGERYTIAYVGSAERTSKIMNTVDVGIAMGALGSDEAMLSADVLIMDRDIKKLSTVMELAKSVFRIVIENYAVGIGLNIITALLAMLGIMPLLAAVIIDYTLTFGIILNTLRIKAEGKDKNK